MALLRRPWQRAGHRSSWRCCGGPGSALGIGRHGAAAAALAARWASVVMALLRLVAPDMQQARLLGSWTAARYWPAGVWNVKRSCVWVCVHGGGVLSSPYIFQDQRKHARNTNA